MGRRQSDIFWPLYLLNLLVDSTVDSFNFTMQLAKNVLKPFLVRKKKKKPCIKSLSIADYRKFCSSSTSQFQFLPVSTKLTCSLYVVGMLFLWTSFDLNYASKWNKNNQKVAINYFSLILFNEFHFHGVWSSWPDPSIALSITWIMYKPIEICLWEESWFPCL